MLVSKHEGAGCLSLYRSTFALSPFISGSMICCRRAVREIQNDIKRTFVVNYVNRRRGGFVQFTLEEGDRDAKRGREGNNRREILIGRRYQSGWMIISRLVGEESATKENARRNGGEGRKGREEKPQNNNWRGERSLTPLAEKEGEKERERSSPWFAPPVR